MLKYSDLHNILFQAYSKVTAIHKQKAMLFQTLFPYKLLQSIEFSSLCYTVGPCWTYYSVHMLIPNS